MPSENIAKLCPELIPKKSKDIKLNSYYHADYHAGMMVNYKAETLKGEESLGEVITTHQTNS